jgi:hypothetical protein
MKNHPEYDLDAALKRTSVKRAELARRLGLTKGACTHWKHSGVPTYVIAYLDLIERHEAFVNRVKLAVGA